METKIFYYSKGTGIFYTVSLLCVAGISVWGLLSDDISIAKRVFACAGLLVSLFLVYSNFKELLKPAVTKLPAIIMDEKGVFIEAAGVTVAWENIAHVKMDSVGRQGDWIFLYLSNKDVANTQPGADQNSDYVHIEVFKYADGWAIYNALKTCCNYYRPGEIRFSRREPETWPSEG